MLCFVHPISKPAAPSRGMSLHPTGVWAMLRAFSMKKQKYGVFYASKKGEGMERSGFTCVGLGTASVWLPSPSCPILFSPKANTEPFSASHEEGKKKKLGENAAVLGHFAGSRNFSLTCESQRVVPATRCQHNGLVAQHLDEPGGFHALGVPVAQLPLLIAT